MNHPAFTRHLIITLLSALSLGFLAFLLKGSLERGVMTFLLAVSAYMLVWLFFGNTIQQEYNSDH